MILLVVLGFWIPGLLIGAALRWRGWTLVGAAPALTFGAVTTGIYVIGYAGIQWSWWTFGAWTVLLAAVLAGASWALRRRSATAGATAEEPPPSETTSDNGPETGLDARRGASRSLTDHLVVGGGVLAGLIVGIITFLRGVGNIRHTLNQDFDAPFHANAIRWIAEHHNPLPAALAPIGNQAGNPNFYYPNTYHALLALLLDHGGLTMPALLNLSALMTVLSVPVGVAAFGVAWRMPTIAVAAAAAACTWFTAFPYDQLWRGPLWPYSAGLAMIPATLAMARNLTVPVRLTAPAVLGAPVGVALAVVGMIGLHPSMLFVVGTYGLVLLLALVLRLEPVNWRGALRSLAITAVAFVIPAIPVVLAARVAAGPTAAYRWPEIATPVEAFGQAILFSPTMQEPNWWLGAVAFVGIGLMIVHRRLMWMVGFFALAGALYVGCAAFDTSLVNTLTVPFYNDSWRVGALLPFVGALAVGEAVFTLADSAGGALRRAMPGRSLASPLPAVACAVLALVVLGGLTSGAYVDKNATRLALHNTDGKVISDAERHAYAWLAPRVGPSEHVVNPVRDGSVWMYALDKIQPLEWTYFGASSDSPEYYIVHHLNELDHNARVRPLLAKFNVRYVIVGFGLVQNAGEIDSGLLDLDDVSGLTQVYNSEGVRVYELRDVTP